MLLRVMPDLSPANARFRDWFYSRWGRENCVILGRTRHAEYERYTQRLSIKMASGGQERYFLDDRTVVVDDDTYLVLNEGQAYGSIIQSDAQVESFSIFFRSGLLEEVLGACTASNERLLDCPDAARTRSIEFLERLSPHDTTVTPVLRYIRHHLRAGLNDDQWYEEQLHFLAERMLVQHRKMRKAALALGCVKPATRMELHRRLSRAADYIHSCYDRDLGLDDMAGVACLSRHHFLRLFRRAYGLTPMQYLHRKRIHAAQRLLRNSDLPAQEVATRVGFNSRPTFYRQLRRWGGEFTE